MLEMRRGLPILKHVDCDHRGANERDETEFLGCKLWTCPKCGLYWMNAKPGPKAPGKTYSEIIDEKFPLR